MKRFWWFLIPLLAFAVLVFFLARGLSKDPAYVPSPLVGKPAPTFELPQLHDPKQTFSPEDLKGRAWLLNVWASWCVSCRVEHPVLIDFARTHPDTPIIGLDYKDQRPDAIAWLKQHGNPYVLSVFDADGRVGIDYGVYGVPETYVIDQAGVIRYKQVGPLTKEVIDTHIDPLLKGLK
jgi:cytochrome c biogenesis protein CcmG, thiol:disulfide interchange protein DsbE